jgi:hypothetical protein
MSDQRVPLARCCAKRSRIHESHIHTVAAHICTTRMLMPRSSLERRPDVR